MINFIKEHHQHQTRFVGDPYYSHPVEIYFIVIDYFFDLKTIIVALLHNVDVLINKEQQLVYALMLPELLKPTLNASFN